jgi:hypothetical protein
VVIMKDGQVKSDTRQTPVTAVPPPAGEDAA